MSKGTKKKGIAINIGLNSVDPGHYDGWDGELNACEYDAADMHSIATSQGFAARTLLTADATRDAVTNAIKSSSQELNGGDILLLSYSGHGGQVPDTLGDEDDGMDETWCLYDGQLLDDELRRLWGEFEAGVRILVISDSCHSGTVIKAAVNEGVHYTEFAPRIMPNEIAARTYRKHKSDYDSISREKPEMSEIGATVRLISGCQDNQYSYDGAFNGAFTGRLLLVWDDGKFKGNYRLFHRRIQNMLPSYQSPNHFVIGAPNPSYDAEKPFAID